MRSPLITSSHAAHARMQQHKPPPASATACCAAQAHSQGSTRRAVNVRQVGVPRLAPLTLRSPLVLRPPQHRHHTHGHTHRDGLLAQSACAHIHRCARAFHGAHKQCMHAHANSKVVMLHRRARARWSNAAGLPLPKGVQHSFETRASGSRPRMGRRAAAAAAAARACTKARTCQQPAARR